MLSSKPSLNQPARAYSAHGHGRGPESPLLKFLIGGGVTVVFEISGGHTIEMLKIIKQTSPESYVNILKRITAQKGVAGLLDGFFPWGALQAVAKGSVFSWGQAQSMTMMHGFEGMSKETKTVLSGGLGGLVQGVAMSPLLLLKTRVMTDPSFRGTGGVFATAVASARVGGRIVSSEGPAALMKGATMFSAKRALDWTTRYLFVVMLENAMRSAPGQKLSTTQEVFASLGGGSLSALATIPMDVMVATFQNAGNAGQKVSTADTIKAQLAKGGLGGSMAFATKGLMARVAHVALTTLLMKNITSAVLDLYEAQAGPKK